MQRLACGWMELLTGDDGGALTAVKVETFVLCFFEEDIAGLVSVVDEWVSFLVFCCGSSRERDALVEISGNDVEVLAIV